MDLDQIARDLYVDLVVRGKTPSYVGWRNLLRWDKAPKCLTMYPTLCDKCGKLCWRIYWEGRIADGRVFYDGVFVPLADGLRVREYLPWLDKTEEEHF